MGIFGAVSSIFGGKAGAKAIEGAARATSEKAEEFLGNIREELDPFLDAGRGGINALFDVILKGDPNNLLGLREGESSLLDQAMRDLEGRLGSRGLSDSSSGRAALLGENVRQREGFRRNRLLEFGDLAGRGQSGINQLNSAQQVALNAIAGANSQIGQAKAAGKMALFNGLGAIGDSVVGAIPGTGGMSGFANRLFG